MIDMSIMVNLI